MTTRYKDKHKVCRFFVVPRGGPVLMGMPDVEMLDFLIVKFNTLEQRRHTREINEQSREDKSCAKNNRMFIQWSIAKILEYIIAGLKKKAGLKL